MPARHLPAPAALSGRRPAGAPRREDPRCHHPTGPGRPAGPGSRRAARGVAGELRALGMTPVLPGCFGPVPPGFAGRDPGARVHPRHLGRFARPDWLDPADPVFAALAADYYAALGAVLRIAGPVPGFGYGAAGHRPVRRRGRLGAPYDRRSGAAERGSVRPRARRRAGAAAGGRPCVSGPVTPPAGPGRAARRPRPVPRTPARSPCGRCSVR
ncbi:alpha-N-acetylglucosaminidase TIM-barrel domain-containing protein [Streptomyces sp. NPDC000656]|uniref:alpha-N-acetylglucosaminidase TIM-barrel domain-containing protein n=1 Tax=unclassified Streptomyces TaxID=2593676 RepID=UPI0036B18308